MTGTPDARPKPDPDHDEFKSMAARLAHFMGHEDARLFLIDLMRRPPPMTRIAPAPALARFWGAGGGRRIESPKDRVAVTGGHGSRIARLFKNAPSPLELMTMPRRPSTPAEERIRGRASRAGRPSPRKAAQPVVDEPPSPQYRLALAALARWQAIVDGIIADKGESGLLLVGRAGATYVHPAVAEVRAAQREVARLTPKGATIDPAPDPAAAKPWKRPTSPPPNPTLPGGGADPLYPSRLHAWTLAREPPGHFGHAQTVARNSLIPCGPGDVRWPDGRVLTPDGRLLGELPLSYFED